MNERDVIVLDLFLYYLLGFFIIWLIIFIMNRFDGVHPSELKNDVHLEGMIIGTLWWPALLVVISFVGSIMLIVWPLSKVPWTKEIGRSTDEL